MTEKEWLAYAEPEPMLDWLGQKISIRRLLLFVSGCCRALNWRFTDPRSWIAVERAEQFAEGAISLEALRIAAVEANRAWSEAVACIGTISRRTSSGEVTALSASRLLSPFLLDEPLDETIRSMAPTVIGYVRRGVKKTIPTQVALLRCVFGNPFRPVTFNPTWLSSTVQNVAESIYTDKSFEKMPVLGDALEDAGCDNQDILSHCRKPGEHCRGCWVVDAVLGKEQKP